MLFTPTDPFTIISLTCMNASLQFKIVLSAYYKDSRIVILMFFFRKDVVVFGFLRFLLPLMFAHVMTNRSIQRVIRQT